MSDICFACGEFFARGETRVAVREHAFQIRHTPSSACCGRPQFRPQVLRQRSSSCPGDEPPLLPLRKSLEKPLFMVMGINVPSLGGSTGRQQDLFICRREPVRELHKPTLLPTPLPCRTLVPPGPGSICHPAPTWCRNIISRRQGPPKRHPAPTSLLYPCVWGFHLIDHTAKTGTTVKLA